MSRSTHGEILENLRDGVLVIGAGGRIETVNPVARELLELEEDLSGVVFAQAFIPRQGLDAFTERVIDVCTSRRKAARSLVDITTKAGTRTLSLAASYLLRGDKIASVVIVFSDVTELRTLRDAERAQHAELQKAYRDIEERNTELAVALRKVRTGQVLGGIIALAILAGAGAWSYHSFSNVSDETPAAHGPVTPANHHVVRATTVRSTITLGGKLAPWRVAPLRSAIDGTVVHVAVEPGQKVERGDVIVEVDQRTVRAQLAAKRQQLTKARETLRELEDWTNSATIVEARRGWTKARLAFETSRTSMNRDRFLHDQGMISKSAYADAERTFTSAELDYAAAKEAFEKTKSRTSPEAIEIARIDVENKQREMEDIADALDQTVVRAPFAGIILPAAGLGATLAAGDQVRAGSDLLRIADFSRVAINVDANERDIVKLTEGQEVTVTGNAFRDLQLKGKLAHVSSRTNSEHDSSFRVRALLDPLDPADVTRIRMGMNALLQILIYKKENAIVVPIHAVSSWAAEHTVTVIDPATLERETRAVAIGPTTYDTVEIVSGLSEGETVLVR